MIYKFSQIVLSVYGFCFSLSIFHELELYENSDIGVFVPFADVFLKHHGSCSGPDDHPCGSVPEEEHRQPVCGTDGKSYVSPEALWCAKLRSSQTGEICKSYCISINDKSQTNSFLMLTPAFARNENIFIRDSLCSLTCLRCVKLRALRVISVLSRRAHVDFRRNRKNAILQQFLGLSGVHLVTCVKVSQ